MPQASRANAVRPSAEKDHTAKAQEQEIKRARGAISCAECRRLKLKCDKTVPCSSCKRRGCASICPNGSLTTGQGTRFILADTDRLHRKITEMSDRIRQLEDALAILQSSVAHDAHPLLRPELLAVKSGLELHAAQNLHVDEGQTEQSVDDDSQAIDAFGTLALRDDGAATFYGRSAGTESLLLDEKTTESPPSHGKGDISSSSLPMHLDQLARSFPASVPNMDPMSLQVTIEGHLPVWQRAEELSNLYLEQAPWFFGAITLRQLREELLPMFYPEANVYRSGMNAETPPAQDGSPAPTITVSTAAFSLPTRDPSKKRSAHDLALLFVVFCFGALTDPKLPPAPMNHEASTYYELTRAALNLEPVLDRPPSVATVQALSLLAIYQGLVADENSIESTWALMGLACRLAQSVGLHRDCARWKLSPAEVQKRRALFWELFITECWQSLATGRSPSFSLPYIDTELPADPDKTLAADGTEQPSFPAWKAMWGKECVFNVVEVTLTARAPKYSLILELDRKIRDVALPKYAQGAPPRGASLSETMQHFMPINYRELTLLYVHRVFFAQALADHPTDPLRSQYAPSFLAGYRSACSLLVTVREQFCINPVQIARFWVLWTHAFSSAVMLASVVTHGGATKTAHAALGELRLAFDLFDKAAKYGGRAVKFLPIVRRLHDKAYAAFSQGYTRPKDIFTPRKAEGERSDELSIFSGRTRTVETKAGVSPPASALPHRPRNPSERHLSPSNHTSHSDSASPTSSDSMRASLSPSMSISSEMSASNASSSDSGGGTTHLLNTYGSSVHPMLVDQIRTFEGDLDAQIYSTQQAFYLANASSVESRNPGNSPVVADDQSYIPNHAPTQQHTWIWNQAQGSSQLQQQPLPQHQHQSVSPSVQDLRHLGQETASGYYAHQDHSSQSVQPSPSQQEYMLVPDPGVPGPSHQSQRSPYYPTPPQTQSMGAPEPSSRQHVQYQYQLPPPLPQTHWAQPPAPTYHQQEQPAPFTEQQQHQQQQYYSHPASTHIHAPNMHDARYAQHVPAPPAVLPIHSGAEGYNLQESWNSFFQHELPSIHPPQPPAGRYAGER